MSKKYNVLLVDDSDSTNLYNQKVIDNCGLASNCITAINGEEALKVLRNAKEGKETNIDIIFLDINMPAMDGWEFLEAAKSEDLLPEQQVILIMLTTSLDPEDLKRAESYKQVKDYLTKPLTEEKIKEILDKHFS